jgi:hypothetical protein
VAIDRLDVRTVTPVLERMLREQPHLPRTLGLAQLIVDAHNRPTGGGLAGVAAALWHVAAADGAQRGHAVTLAALLEQIGRINVTAMPDARGRWLALAFQHAAIELPTGPDSRRAYPPPAFLFPATTVEGLRTALNFGLAHGWRSGHHQATESVLQAFGEAVEDLVGEERLITTFLVPDLPAHALLEELQYLAYRAVEVDREHPGERSDPHITVAAAVAPFLTATTPVGSPAFRAPLRRLARDQPPPRRIRPAQGPRRRGPGRA